MGVGMQFSVGAKVAKPDKPVIVLHGDGSFGLNAMEFDGAVRHRLGVLVRNWPRRWEVLAFTTNPPISGPLWSRRAKRSPRVHRPSSTSS